MHGHRAAGLVEAHQDSRALLGQPRLVMREEREELEDRLLAPGATRAWGAGDRARPEQPSRERTCFERDRDRIVHSTSFRRLAGKTQVVVYPSDHQRTRLSHALEVAQVATSIARGLGVNVALTEAIALGHDCGHGPGGHASEDAFDPYLPEGYQHGPWGADVALAPLNLCSQTLDGIRNHSWSRPAPATVEGEIVSWSDRIAYCAHDFEDAVHAQIISPEDLPDEVAEVCGRRRSDQLRTFIHAVLASSSATGRVGMDPVCAQALAGLRAFNYQRIYTRPESVAQADAVIGMLRSLVDYLTEHPGRLPPGVVTGDPDRLVREVVTYVGGMTDRYAITTATELLGFDPSAIPPGLRRMV
ncbi:MAG: HD domain-containing protein [Actinomycetia bacterium]|nr:HD domain-containing protein [Actinomycetes bacterium]